MTHDPWPYVVPVSYGGEPRFSLLCSEEDYELLLPLEIHLRRPRANKWVPYLLSPPKPVHRIPIPIPRIVRAFMDLAPADALAVSSELQRGDFALLLAELSDRERVYLADRDALNCRRSNILGGDRLWRGILAPPGDPDLRVGSLEADLPDFLQPKKGIE